MPKEYNRSRRVADLIQREMAVLIQRLFQNNEAGLVTVSNVDVSPDLKNARIYFTCMANVLDAHDIEIQLNELTGQFRHELAQVLSLRSVPRISFRYDQALERANRLSSLIDSLHKDDPDSHEP